MTNSSAVSHCSGHGPVKFRSSPGTDFSELFFSLSPAPVSSISCPWVSENSTRSSLIFLFLKVAQYSHHPLGYLDLQPSPQLSLWICWTPSSLYPKPSTDHKCSLIGRFPCPAHCASSLFHCKGRLLARTKFDIYQFFSLVVEGMNIQTD